MSAAEKLKTLGREISQFEHGYFHPERTQGVLSALPHIIAVVDAAEKLYAEAATSAPLWDDIDAALVALDEALK